MLRERSGPTATPGRGAPLQLPSVYLVAQQFERPRVDDIEGAIRCELGALDLGQLIRPGQSVALAVGSRGIPGIERVVAAVVVELRALGAQPFVVPAMGSHGGGTAEGQRAVLAGLGVTEARCGCPVRATMDVVELGRTPANVPVLCDRLAAQADHVGLINRVKPHTRLVGPVESGLAKMCLIGLGKREGARSYHRAFERQGWDEVVETASPIVVAGARLCFGLAIVQNAYDELAELLALRPEDFAQREPALLQRARQLMGRLPFTDVDLLVVDEMGKEISGTGMDPTITGRKPGSPMRVTHVFVRQLTDRSRGNAQGIGLADFTTRRLVDRIDFDALYLNSQTAFRTDTCKIPMTFDSDREALQAAVQMAGVAGQAGPLASYRLVWIRNTAQLDRVVLSEAYLQRVRHAGLEVLQGPLEIAFDDRGNLVSPWPRRQQEEESP